MGFNVKILAMSRLIETISDLVSFRTTADNPVEIEKCFDYISDRLGFYPFIVRKFEHQGVSSRVWMTSDTLTPEVVLNAHVDVVPGSAELFQMRSDNGKIYGRGVMDMKFAIACCLETLEAVHSSHRLPSLALMLTSDEERGGTNGVGYLVDEIGFRPKVVIIPDGGANNHIVEEAKGVLHLRVSAQGKSAHASRPWEGDNAINKVVAAAQKAMELYPVPNSEQWKTTLNLGKINGGVQTNQVPDQAEVYLDIRHVSQDRPEKIIEQIKQASPGCQVELLIHANAFKISRDNPYIRKWADLLTGAKPIFIKENGASDGRFFSTVGVPTIVSQPIGGAGHSNDEWCDVKSVQEFNERLKRYLLGLI